MGSLMLLHVIFARKRFVAGGTEDVFLARMLLPMTSGMTRRGKGVTAGVASGVGTRVFLFDRFGRGVGWSRRRGRGGR